MLKDRESSKRHVKRRQLLIDNGVLVAGDNCLIFTRDYEFTSPSLAAATICGGSANGLTKWRTKEGKTLKEMEGGEV